MGRVKLKIKKLENTNGRQATYAKRRMGIFKKANELAILCDIDIVLVMFSPSGIPALYCGKRSGIEEMIAKLSQVKPQERTKKKLESLDVLKKIFRKLEHDVKIGQFIAKCNSPAEELSTQVRMLQTQISEVHRRLSYWTEPDKLYNVDHLTQLEISIRQSLEQLRSHKEHLEKQQVKIENENFLKDWSTLMEDGIQIPLEQDLQSMPWVFNSNGTNIVAEEDNKVPKREVECSASSSFGSYPVYFGTGKSQEIIVSSSETRFLDELELKPQTNSHHQFTNITPYDPIPQNDLNHQLMLPPPPSPHNHPSIYNFPMEQREYHVNGFFEAPPPPECSAYNNTNQTRFGPSSSSMPSSISMFDEYLFSQI